MRGILTLGLIALLCVSTAHAQETTTGTIAGRVIDAQHLPVPGATVTITTPQGPKAITTDADGRFFAAFLPPGTYDLKVELTGSRPAKPAESGAVADTASDPVRDSL
jgi:hypothetical protein